MHTSYLSKTDFKVARTCRAKLWYKKQKYPTTYEYDEYMQLLADGGFKIGKLAQLLYPDGIEVDTGSLEGDIAETDRLLQKEEITLCEPAIYVNHKLIRVDILVKNGERFDLIEVKSKSFDAAEKEERDNSHKKKDYFEQTGWVEYVEDVAYQYLTLREKYPRAAITPYLLMPDKTKTNEIEDLIHWFEIKKTPTHDPRRKRIETLFTGDAEQVRKNHFLSCVDVTESVENVLETVESEAELLIENLLEGKKYPAPIGCHCRDCEYTVVLPNYPGSGFQRCWGPRADSDPHILDLAYLGSFNRQGQIDRLIDQGFSKLTDIDPAWVKHKYGNRSYWQLTKNEEFLLPDFQQEVANLEYPLHFIDFETSMMAVPYHAGMRPYEKVFFQWSCHTLEYPEAEPVHIANLFKTYRPEANKGAQLNYCFFSGRKKRDKFLNRTKRFVNPYSTI